MKVPAVTVQVGKSCSVYPAVNFSLLAKDASFSNAVSGNSRIVVWPMANLALSLPKLTAWNPISLKKEVDLSTYLTED
jgi:hypothetical protein